VLYIIADDVGNLKFHLSTAVRTAISTHVAEILRDAGQEVMLYPIVNFEATSDLCRTGKTCFGNCQATGVHHGKLGRYHGELLYILLVNIAF
jgi:hypothetical protein